MSDRNSPLPQSPQVPARLGSSRMLRPREASQELGVPLPTIYHWLQRDVLSHVVVGGGRYLIPESSLQGLYHFRSASPAKPKMRRLPVPGEKILIPEGTARKDATPSPILLIISDNELSRRNIAVACGQLSCVVIFVHGMDEAAAVAESSKPTVIWSDSSYSMQKLSEVVTRCVGSPGDLNVVIEHDSERGASPQPSEFATTRWQVLGTAPSEAVIVRVLHGCGLAFQSERN
jgi:excisionase family DNA binding protein